MNQNIYQELYVSLIEQNEQKGKEEQEKASENKAIAKEVTTEETSLSNTETTPRSLISCVLIFGIKIAFFNFLI